MSKRESNSVRLDKQGVPKVMHIFDYFADSLRMFSLNAISGLVGQLTYFYTDKVGAAAGAIATMFLICKIVDAFTDLIMGHICDSTKPGKEKYRPWLLRAGVPAGIMLVLLFMVPKGANQTVQFIYMCITNLMMTAILYTAISIPYGAIMMIRTPSQEERGVMDTWRAAAGYVSGMVIAIAVIPITNALGGDQSAWIKMGAVFGVLILINMIICWKCSKESAVDRRIISQIKEKKPEEMTVVTEATKQAIFTFSIYIPLIAFIMMFVFMLRYDLDKVLPEINKDLAERKENRKAKIIAARK